MKHRKGLFIAVMAALVVGCAEKTQEAADSRAVSRQQKQYAIAQPIPTFNHSLERELVIQLYHVRNTKAATHSVWRSDRGLVEGDCPSYGYGIPYDTSLTNPMQTTDTVAGRTLRKESIATIEQPEPNGIFSSKNTAATWVMCLGEAGTVEPVYIETKVTVYPGPVIVDYETNRVTRSGGATVLIPTQ